MIGVISYSLGGVAFFLLSLWLFISWRGRLKGALLLSAALVTALWLATSLYHLHSPVPMLLHLMELAKNLAWLSFLLQLSRTSEGAVAISPVIRPFVKMVVILTIGLLLIDLGYYFSGLELVFMSQRSLWTFQHLLLGLSGLVLVEQVFRNLRFDKRWALKFMLLGVGGLFAYDFFLYAHALMFRQLDYTVWMARGLVYAIVVPFIAIAAARQQDWSLDVFLSRRVVFHSAALAGAGIYLVIMALAGYYIRIYGGQWGTVIQVAFVFTALLLLLVVLFSGQMRAMVRVFFNKHFFNYKYDYRLEWLRFINTLAANTYDQELCERAIIAISQIVDSGGGVLWLMDDNGDFQVTSRVNSGEAPAQALSGQGGLVTFLQQTGWVIDLCEYREEQDKYLDLQLESWVAEVKQLRLIVPLIHGDELFAIMALTPPRAQARINWEDHDLLKTAGRQTAGYLALMRSSEALGEARQFEAFNRLSAFVVHDLKNVVAQLTLVVSNAKRHRQNPAFVDDAFMTIENAVERMNKMLSHLRQDQRQAVHAHGVLNLDKVVRAVCKSCESRRPVPLCNINAEGAMPAKGDADRFAAVLEHLVQNAQDATPDDGMIEVTLSQQGTQAVLNIIDTGCGMDETFIRDRLFKPFDTTKGNAGMGIGVYEAREYIVSIGGKIAVSSEPGRGTLFSITIPLLSLSGDESLQASEVR